MKNSIFVFVLLFSAASSHAKIDCDRVTQVSVISIGPILGISSLMGHESLRFSYGTRLAPEDIVVNPSAEFKGEPSIPRCIGIGIPYPSIALEMTYEGMLQQYSRDENRALTTYVLDLNQDQIRKIVDASNRAIEHGIKPRFNYFTYNCSYMVTALLQEGNLGLKTIPHYGKIPLLSGPTLKAMGLVKSIEKDLSASNFRDTHQQLIEEIGFPKHLQFMGVKLRHQFNSRNQTMRLIALAKLSHSQEGGTIHKLLLRSETTRNKQIYRDGLSLFFGKAVPLDRKRNFLRVSTPCISEDAIVFWIWSRISKRKGARLSARRMSIPLNDLNAPADLSSGEWSAAVLETHRIDGKLYLIPYVIHARR